MSKIFLPLLLCMGMVTAHSREYDVDDQVSNPLQAFVKCAIDALKLVRVLWNTASRGMRKSSFRTVLEVVSNLVGAMYSDHHMPRVPERWWGEEHHRDSRIRPFRVRFTDEMVSDLRYRIHNRRNLTRALQGTAHTYGTHSDYLNHFLDHWADEYRFHERENYLNRFPHYITNIQGLDIHYMHVKPHNPHHKKVLPLLLLHGWPNTGFEYVHVMDKLLKGNKDCGFVFEIIVPDLPGFGYSEGAHQIGMSQYQMAVIMKNLMRRLGKPRFYIHAGDMGQFVADSMAILYPDRVMGLHTNFAFSLRPQTMAKYLLGQLHPEAVVKPEYEDRMYPLAEKVRFYVENTGYFHIQATRPDNIGHGLDDSPVLIASWLVENIIAATSLRNLLVIHGNLTQSFHMVDWFDALTVFWASQSGTTSVRTYAEISAWFQDPLVLTMFITPTPVPFAAIKFRYELIYQPDDFLRDKYPNLLQSTTLDYGGHFAGYEEPDALVNSIWTAIKKMEAFNARHDVMEGVLV